MAFQLGDDDNHGMSEINLIPLIDIMLVLMIIFLVTATVLNPTIPLTLPKTDASAPIINKDTIIKISIDKDNVVFIDKKPVKLDDLAAELTKIRDTSVVKITDVNGLTTSTNEKIPLNVHIRADKDSNYAPLAKTLAIANKVGLTNISFVSDSL